MNFLRTLFLLVAGLSVAWCGPRAQIQPIGLTQFRKMMLCTMPFSWPIFDYAVYGCYCGKSTGGSGTPVDELDRCCQVHDKCYGDAKQLKECWSIIHNPYLMYTYRCVKHSKTVTCGENNNVCEMFLCECDRKAAECFARSTYHPENKHLPQGKCQTNMVKA